MYSAFVVGGWRLLTRNPESELRVDLRRRPKRCKAERDWRPCQMRWQSSRQRWRCYFEVSINKVNRRWTKDRSSFILLPGIGPNTFWNRHLQRYQVKCVPLRTLDALMHIPSNSFVFLNLPARNPLPSGLYECNLSRASFPVSANLRVCENHSTEFFGGCDDYGTGKSSKWRYKINTWTMRTIFDHMVVRPWADLNLNHSNRVNLYSIQHI